MICCACHATELWRPVSIPGKPEYSDLYEVSNRGSVRAFSRTIEYMRGSTVCRRVYPAHDMSLIVNSHGYVSVGLKRPGFPARLYGVHRLVAWAFCAGASRDAQVLHKDDNRLHSCSRNLYFGSQEDNIQDMKDRKRFALGTRHGLTTLSEANVLEVVRLSRSGCTNKEVGDRFNISGATVSNIMRGRSWGHVTKIPKQSKRRRS